MLELISPPQPASIILNNAQRNAILFQHANNRTHVPIRDFVWLIRQIFMDMLAGKQQPKCWTLFDFSVTRHMNQLVHMNIYEPGLEQRFTQNLYAEQV